MRRIFQQYSVYSTHPTDTVTNRRRPAIYAAPTPVPYPTSVSHDDQQRSRSDTAAFWSSAGRNSFYPRTAVRRVVALWGSQQHQIFLYRMVRLQTSSTQKCCHADTHLSVWDVLHTFAVFCTKECCQSIASGSPI